MRPRTAIGCTRNALAREPAATAPHRLRATGRSTSRAKKGTSMCSSRVPSSKFSQRTPWAKFAWRPLRFLRESFISALSQAWLLSPPGRPADWDGLTQARENTRASAFLHELSGEFMRSLKHLFIVIGCLIVSGAAADRDWPQWRGPSANGISEEKQERIGRIGCILL